MFERLFSQTPIEEQEVSCIMLPVVCHLRIIYRLQRNIVTTDFKTGLLTFRFIIKSGRT